MRKLYTWGFAILLAIMALPVKAVIFIDPPQLVFKENRNQWNKEVLLMTETQSGSIFFCKNNFTYLLADTADLTRLRNELHRVYSSEPNLDNTLHVHAFRTTFLNASPQCSVKQGEALKEYYNYYIGKDPAHWASHVKAMGAFSYQNIYDGINLDITSSGLNLKYSFAVNKGARASDIQIGYEGVDELYLMNGELKIKTSIGEISDLRPYAYQIINGETKEVACVFKLTGKQVSFEFPDGYDDTQTLVIDPVLIFSTYSGSTADNFGYSATYDSHGNTYVAGTVFELNHFPTTLGAFQTSWAGGLGYGVPGSVDGSGTDIGITKYDPQGTQRIYSTYLGGNADELPHSLVVNGNDELFVFGTTSSENFPVTPGAFDTTYNGGPDAGLFGGIAVHYANGSDLFVTRFNQSGTGLVASTYIGGSGNDGLTYPEYVGLHYNYADEVRGEIDIDKDDNVFIATCTRSTDFPVTAGAFQTTNAGGTDGVVMKLNSDLTAMLWGTYLGGSQDDAIYSVAFDRNGNLYVAGGTQSRDLRIVQGAVQPVYNGGRCDGFIAQISGNGSALLHSTYYGAPQYDQVYFVETDKENNVYVLGQIDSSGTSFIHNAVYNVPDGGQYVSKITPGLDSIIWSTTFGRGDGNPDISPTAFLVDVCDKIYISGWGSDFTIIEPGAPDLSTGGLEITPNAYQAYTDSQDFYVMVLKDDASAVAYATYFGDSTNEEHVDGGTSRFDRKGIIYQAVCAGCGHKSTFPTTPGVVSRTNNSPNCNNAVFKLDLQLPLVIADFDFPKTGCIPFTVNFTNHSKTILSPKYKWIFGDGGTSTDVNPSHIYTTKGVYDITLIVTDPGSCNGADTVVKKVMVIIGPGIDTLPAITVCDGSKKQIGIPPDVDSATTYLWIPANDISSPTVSNPLAGPRNNVTYRLFVTRDFCTDTFDQKVVVFKDTIHATGGNVKCPRDHEQLSVTHVQTNQQLTYNWKPAGEIVTGGNTATPVVAPSKTETFIVTVTNQYQCVYTDSVHVTVFDPTIVAGFNAPGAICIPDTAAFINTSTTIKTPVYFWTFGDGATSTDTNPTHIYFKKGVANVTLTVSDTASCNGVDTARKQILVLAGNGIDTLPTFTICKFGSVRIGTSSNGDSVANYRWVPTDSLSATNIANPVADPIVTTDYYLIVSKDRCSDTFKQRIIVFEDVLNLTGRNAPCPGDTVRLSVTDSQPGQQYRYVWKPSAPIISGDSTATPIAVLNRDVTFTVTGTNQIGCVFIDSIHVRVLSSLASIQAFANPDTILYGDTSQLGLTLNTDVTAYQWFPDPTLSATNIIDPVAFPKETRGYAVLVTDTFGCKKRDSVIVYVVHTPCADANVYVPNAFSPNNDGKNDVLYARSNYVESLVFSVYDRWGQKVFETKDITIGWDGNFKGKPLDPGVFGYYVQGICSTGSKFFKKGNVTLIR